MTRGNLDDVPLTTEQLIQEAGRGIAEAEHNARVAAQTGQTPTDRLETLSDADLLAEWQKESSKLEEAEREKLAFETARQFLCEEPRYAPTEWNATRVDAYVKAKFGENHVPSVDDLHAVFAALADRGLLEVRETPRSPRKVLTDSELESMSLPELEQLANEEAITPGRYRRQR